MKNTLKLFVILVVFNSCTNNYLKYPESEEKILRLSKNEVFLPTNSYANIDIISGVGGYSVESEDNAIATAKLVGKQITITPIIPGDVQIVVKDTQTSQTKKIKVDIRIIDFEEVAFVEGTQPEKPYKYGKAFINIKNFKLDKNEVTVELFCEFLNKVYNQNIPASYSYKRKVPYINYVVEDESYKYTPEKGKENIPMTYITWGLANEYAKWKGGRLPTSTEFEYAAQGGKYGPGNGLEVMTYEYIDTHAWWEHNTFGYEAAAAGIKHDLQPVRLKKPINDELELYDMIGNASEWVQDDIMSTYEEIPTNGDPFVSPNSSNNKIYQGGSFGRDDAWKVYNTIHKTRKVGWRDSGYWPLGFRVAYDYAYD